MTRDEVISMAREAGFVFIEQRDGSVLPEHSTLIESFAVLVAAAERKECARACQAIIDGGIYDEYQQYAAAACRNWILARGEKG